MDMRLMLKFLIPGVEHTEEADLGAEMLGIASDLEEGFWTCPLNPYPITECIS
jgi:hypothetical protein